MRSVRRAGRGLHGGALSSVTLHRRPGPVALVAGGKEAPLSSWRIAVADRATTLELEGRRVATVEHLFAACAGMGVHRDLCIEVEGDEVPLLDGGAREWCDALVELGGSGASTGRASLVVREDGEVDVGASRYRFSPGDFEVCAEISFGDARVDGSASWRGSPEDFRGRVASARTFAFVDEVLPLAEAGLASHVSKEAVVVIAPDAVLFAGAPFAADEPARHKLLDLVGDLFVHGGPPRGRVHAFRPGHARNHAALETALARGILGLG